MRKLSKELKYVAVKPIRKHHDKGGAYNNTDRS